MRSNENKTVRSYPIVIAKPLSENALGAWACEEFLARVALPYVLDTASEESSNVLCIAVDRSLPDDIPGVAIYPAQSKSTDPVAVLQSLAGGTFRKDYMAQIGPAQVRIDVSLSTLYEAYLGDTRKYSRDGSGAGFASHEKSLSQCPASDLLADEVYQALKRCACERHICFPERLSPWPDNRRLAVHLSHDMDYYIGRTRMWRKYATWSRAWFRCLLRRDSEGLTRNYRRIAQYLFTDADPQYTLPDWISLEADYGARSSFYFFLHGQYYSPENALELHVLRT